MVHTFRLVFKLWRKHVWFLRNAYDIDAMEVGKYFGDTFNGVTLTVYRRPNKQALYLSLIVDAPLMLDKGEITEGDLLEIEGRLMEILTVMFGDQKLYHQHQLMRIDYRFDSIIEEASVRKAYVDLYNKSYRKKARRLKKSGRINVQGFYEEYETGVEHKNGSVETAVYDKMAERRAKKKPIKAYEKDVLRFEVRLKEKFMSYQKGEYEVPRELKVYFSKEKYRQMMYQYILGTYLTKDFVRYSLAVGYVERSQFGKQVQKAITKFLRTVSRGDLSSPQNSMAAATFNRRLAECTELGFHPITIPNSWKHLPDFLENPLSVLESIINSS
ncbi:hypothetical protein [Sporosarcina aquimarina]|uniref:hypothetical protein n=1 Tax=Sporosarcina aquimarina TaxID=114975 RepID=UPI001C8E2782|nr:hypothetical protein [Sporosarcina aquimarina]MBY0221776.1 hypothetical protein [Sporosarcina aquimarina]